MGGFKQISSAIRRLVSYREADDDFLVQKITQGNQRAFEEILNRYQAGIHGFAFRFCGNAEEAEEIAQETFLRLYRNAKGFRSGGSLKAYLFRIARNLCIDSKRKMRPDLPGVLRDRANGPAPDEQIINKEKLSALSLAVQKLPEKQKTAILLKHTENMSAKEIANLMGTTVPAVEALLFRGRKTLKDTLKPEPEAPEKKIQTTGRKHAS